MGRYYGSYRSRQRKQSLKNANLLKKYPITYKSKKIPGGSGICRSHLEHSVYKNLDNDPSVISFTPEPFWISYEHNREKHYYHPDILVEYSNRKVIVEVKPPYEVDYPINIAKFEAATTYAADKNVTFEVWVRSVANSENLSGYYAVMGNHLDWKSVAAKVSQIKAEKYKAKSKSGKPEEYNWIGWVIAAIILYLLFIK